jgi:phage tail sheath protein FI
VAEFLSPGIFIEEVANAAQSIEAVGTSTMAIVGWTKQGPTNEATLVTSPQAFLRTFGGNTKDSLVPLSVSAFFTNGGTRCYVVRVVPSDAVAATGCITEVVTGEDPQHTGETTPFTSGSTITPVEAPGTLAYSVQLAKFPLTSAALTIKWKISTVAKSATLTGTSTVGGTNGGAGTGNLLSATIDRATGALTLTFDTTGPDADSVTIDYTYCIWSLAAISQGVWGNDVRLTLKGNDNFFVYAPPGTTNAGTWTKFDVLVSVLNAETGAYEVKETYEELSFTDPDDAMFAPDVVNDGSDLVRMTDNGWHFVPSSFAGATTTNENTATAPNGTLKQFTGTLANSPVVKGSVKLTYVIGTVTRTAIADVNGKFSGTGIDATKTNTIDYTTGAYELNFSTAPDSGAGNVKFDYIKTPAVSSVNYDLAGGSDGTISLITQSTVSLASTLQVDRKGLYALDRIDEMLQIIIPDFAGSTAVQGDMIDYCENRRDCFAVLTTPKGMSAQEAVDYVRITFARKSKYAAMYWPWLNVADPLNNGRALTMPAVAHVAGVYARTDINKNVGKAPAGTVDGALRGLLSLEKNPDKGERDVVYPARINPLINTPQTGMAVWGVRTLSSTNDAFKYVNAVRLFIFVEKSIFNSTHSLVFESINSNLYAAIKTQLDSFLLNLYNTGHFAGATPAQAFSVVCDGSNNPPEVVNAGQVVIDVALAPNRPGEFIRFRLAQKTLS